jgi:hypothetical protein
MKRFSNLILFYHARHISDLSCSYVVHTRFVNCQNVSIVLTLKQLQNGCNVSRLFRPEKQHMKGHTIIAKTANRFTSARLGECI